MQAIPACGPGADGPCESTASQGPGIAAKLSFNPSTGELGIAGIWAPGWREPGAFAILSPMATPPCCCDCGKDGPDVIYVNEPVQELDMKRAVKVWICRRCYDQRIKYRGATH